MCPTCPFSTLIFAPILIGTPYELKKKKYSEYS